MRHGPRALTVRVQARTADGAKAGTMKSMTTNHVLAVDGTNLLYRSYHAMASSKLEHAGRPIWAVHGLFVQLAKILSGNTYTHMTLAFDSAGGCASRKKLYPEYKANRPSPDENIVYQLQWAPSILRQCGIHVVAMDGWEADDIVASCVNQAEKLQYTTTVLSSDKDCIQLVGKATTMLTMDGKVYNLETLKSIMGCTPLGYRTIAALRGEPGDNLPGVKGVGTVTATKLVDRFEDINAIFGADDTDLRKIVSAKILESLRRDESIARRTYGVAELNRHLTVDVEQGKLTALNPENIKKILTSVGLPHAGERISRALHGTKVSQSPF